MAIAYPISLGFFFDDLNISGMSCTLTDPRQFNQNAAGTILDASLGSRLWTGEVSAVPASHKILSGMEARIEYAMRPGGSFFMYDKRHMFPQDDPDGTILGASAPLLASVNANNIDITISGLPVGYTLTRGDMMSFIYLSSPTRYAMHRINLTSSADGAGVISTEVVPSIRAGFTIGAAVALITPVMKAKIVPGSYQPPSGAPGMLSSGLSFQFMQAIK